jgi:hypothetical protein
MTARLGSTGNWPRPAVPRLPIPGSARRLPRPWNAARHSLQNMGHAVRLEDGRIRVSKDLIANLERTEVAHVGKAMAAERGLTFNAAKTGEYVAHLSARPSSRAAASP